MPRIDDQLLECVIYLYPTVEDANDGRRRGGAGLWVGVKSVAPGCVHTYVVTNGHVVRDGQGESRIIRINNRSGGFDTIETEKGGWIFHPDGDDVAIYPLEININFKARYIFDSQLVSREILSRYDIGPGNDTISVGRLLSHDGKETNNPVLRFGNIAMMPIEPVETDTGILQESFLVEGRSILGSSGSPVFVLFNIGDRLVQDGVPMFQKVGGPWLLGINWGHLRLVDSDFEYVRDAEGKKIKDLKVRVNTGMMQVVPAWKIQELLDVSELVEKRKADAVEHAKSAVEYLRSLDIFGVSKEMQKKMHPLLFSDPDPDPEQGT